MSRLSRVPFIVVGAAIVLVAGMTFFAAAAGAAFLPDPGNISNAPAGLISFWDFDEGAGPDGDGEIDFAYDRVGSSDGSFENTTIRTAGLVGTGAASFNGAPGSGVSVGNSVSSTTSITIEALFTTTWNGATFGEFFRKDDGGNLILFSFQPAGAIDGVTPGIAFGLNVGGFTELDVAFDGLDGRPTLAEVADGNAHHIAATYDQATGFKAVYLDGALIGSTNLVAGTGITSGGGASASIGARPVGSETFNGVIDEFAFYNVALSQAEIETHFQNVLAGNNYFVPEPSSMVLALVGLLGLVGRRRRSRQG